MRHYAFRFLLGGSTVVRHPLAKNEIPLDFSQSLQRAGQHIFLHAHLLLHAERRRHKPAPDRLSIKSAALIRSFPEVIYRIHSNPGGFQP